MKKQLSKKVYSERQFQAIKSKIDKSNNILLKKIRDLEIERHLLQLEINHLSKTLKALKSTTCEILNHRASKELIEAHCVKTGTDAVVLFSHYNIIREIWDIKWPLYRKEVTIPEEQGQ